MYVDTVIHGKLVHKPKFLGLLFGVAFAALFALNLADTVFGRFLTPVIGDPATSGLHGRFAVALVLGLLLTLNIVLIGFLPTPVQVFVVWIELATFFVGGFHVFNLSLEFIQEKFWVLITKGLFTTIYVSAISIVLAFICALTGAIAKLSGNGFALGIANFYTSLLRALPLLLLYLIYLGLPQVGYVIDAVPVIIPPTGNMFIPILKNSSLVSVIGVWELMFLARTLGQKTFQHMEMLITVAMIYWALTVVLEAIQARLERHYQTAKKT